MKVGDLVEIVSDLNLPVNDPDSLVRGEIINKVVYHVVVECEDGILIEGDMDDLTALRSMRKIDTGPNWSNYK